MFTFRNATFVAVAAATAVGLTAGAASAANPNDICKTNTTYLGVPAGTYVRILKYDSPTTYRIGWKTYEIAAFQRSYIIQSSCG